MIQVKKVFPECCADTILVELILQRGRPSHYHGINNVGQALIKYNKNDFIIGVIDTDKFKRPDPNIELFTVIVEDKLRSEKLLIRKQPETNKHIIRIHPEFEPWIWDLAIECGINPNDEIYGFESIEKLYTASKSVDVFDNQKFRKFVNAVILKNPPPIQTLRLWLTKVF